MLTLLFCLNLFGEVTLDSGLKLHYQTWGERGPVVLLIAGWGTQLEIWQPLAEKLANDHQLVAFDARGIGRSGDSDAAYSTQSMADEAAALMKKLGHHTYAVAGISLGSFVAQKLAHTYPDRLERLILIATSLGGAEHVPPSQEVMGFFMRSPSMEPEQLAREGMQWALHPHFRAEHEDQIEAMIQAKIAEPTAKKTLMRQSMAAMMSDHGKDAGSIGVPTLIIHGEADQLVPIANGEKTAKAIANSRFVSIPHSGHVSIIDQTDKVAKVIIDFLKKPEN